MYQLCLGEEPVASLIDRITDRSCRVAPELERDACRRLVALIVRARLRRTAACGSDRACQPDGSVLHSLSPPRQVTAQWLDADPKGLPEMFAASTVDLIGNGADRQLLELRLAAVFRSVLRPILFSNPRCGHAAVCGGEPVFDDLDQIDGEPDGALSA